MLVLMGFCCLAFTGLDANACCLTSHQIGNAADCSNHQASPEIRRISAPDLTVGCASFSASGLYFVG